MHACCIKTSPQFPKSSFLHATFAKPDLMVCLALNVYDDSHVVIYVIASNSERLQMVFRK